MQTSLLIELSSVSDFSLQIYNYRATMNFRLLLTLSISLTLFVSADARRRQRVDSESPIQPAADAPWNGSFFLIFIDLSMGSTKAIKFTTWWLTWSTFMIPFFLVKNADNLATASGDEPVFEKVVSVSVKPTASSEAKKEKDVAADSAVECDADNVNFELVTGFVKVHRRCRLRNWKIGSYSHAAKA